MATPTPLAGSASIYTAPASRLTTEIRIRSFLVYWHLLSLDAPTVAMLWTWFIARTCGIHLPFTAILAMGTAVWLLYATDRLLDSQPLPRKFGTHGLAVRKTLQRETTSTESYAHRVAFTSTIFQSVPVPGTVTAYRNCLEIRHLFHRLHRRSFRAGVLIAAIGLAVMVPELTPESMHLYGILGSLLIVYFAVIHLKQNPATRLPKEIAVGIFFSAATFIPTVARNSALRAQLLPVAIVFGLTCSLNCLFIYKWEHRAPFPEAHLTTRLALRMMRPLACVIIIGGLSLTLGSSRWQLPCAVAMAATFLLLLNVNRRHFEATALRTAADLCLLTPLLFVATLPL